MMNTLAGMGLAGSAVLLLWLPASKLLKNRLPARWYYRILKISLCFFLIPVGRLLSLTGQALSAARPAASLPVSIPAQAVPNIPAAAIPQLPLPALAPAPAPLPETRAFVLSAGGLRTLAAIWAVGAAAMLAYKAYVYFRLRRRVFRQNRPVSSKGAQLVFRSCKRQLGIQSMVDLWENPAVRSPFAAGVLRPTVVIPAVSLEQEELRYLFLHELTHIKYGDLLVRFAAMTALIIHWYNPFAYLLCRSIQTLSEQSCDERIAGPLPAEERYVYGNVILKLAATAAAGSGDWAASLSARETIERRLIRVLHTKKLKGPKRLAALALAIAILACGGGAALAARSPLPVSQRTGKTPQTVSTVQTGNPENSGGSATAPVGTAPTVPAPREDGAEAPETPETDRPVTTNGTPSEAFLKELRAHFGASENTPVLFGDHELILQRGGTLLPDEEFSSYCAKFTPSPQSTCTAIYKTFYTKESEIHPSASKSVLHSQEEYQVGNRDILNKYELEELKQLVNGEYPKNSRGESYGSDIMSGYVGYRPDLFAALGTKGEDGYLARTEIPPNAPTLPEDECPHSFLFPLYDSEHREIGKFERKCGGHTDFAAAGMDIDEAKAAIAAGSNTIDEDKAATASATITYDDPSEETLAMIRRELAAKWPEDNITANTPIHFGDKDLILSRGGTLLPDNDPKSYGITGSSIYKKFLDKNGEMQSEYLVGNKNAVDPREVWMLDTLTPDGDYPKNSRGESYGCMNLFAYVGYWPDLEYLAEYPYENRPAGYVYSRDDANSPLNRYDPNAAQKPRTQIDSPAYQAWRTENPSPTAVPLYDSEGNIIGSYDYGPSSSLDTTGMSIEEAKAALENAP